MTAACRCEVGSSARHRDLDSRAAARHTVRMRNAVRARLARCAIALCAAACGSPARPPAPEPVPRELGFPRIASYFIETHVDAAARDVMARSDLVVVDAEAAALDRAPLDAIRAARPDAVLFAYVTSEEIARTPSAERPLATARFERIPPAAWLAEPGSRLTASISASDTLLRVADPSAFTVHRPPSPFHGADEPTYVLVGGEHMRVVAIEGEALRVERGYRSHAVAHAAGARVASHVVFFAGTWMLDLAASGGEAWRALLADELVALVARGPWNGVFLDVCFEDISWLNGGLLDVDRDGLADDPHAASRQWSAGMGLLVHELRARLPAGAPIVANPGAQDCPHDELDGILLEGWPLGMPPQDLAFDTGYARYARWSHHRRGLAIADAFSPNIGFGTIAPGQDAVAHDDYAAMRFGLAVALLDDGYYTYDNGVFGHYVAWSYDEYDGAGRGAHWLGAALGPARARGSVRWREFEHGLAVVNLGDAPAVFAAPPGVAKLAGRQDPAHNDGRPVGATLVLAPRDAYVLARIAR